ncbi:winged helix-turn-helix domain-containing protein [Methanocaldococcus sp.]
MEKDPRMRILKELIERGRVDDAVKLIEMERGLIDLIYPLLVSKNAKLKINCVMVLGNLYLKGKINDSCFIKYLEDLFLDEDKNLVFKAFSSLRSIPEMYQNEITCRLITKYLVGYEKYKTNLKKCNTLPNMKRDKIIIIFDILRTIKNSDLKKTNIMYATNLDWRTLNNYINYLIKNEFIREEEEKYSLTDRGKLLLEKIEEVLRLIYFNE